MKHYFLFISIIFLTIFVSCKNDKKEDTQKIDSKIYKISFDLITEKPDSLQLFYCNDSVQNFVPEKSLWNSTVGDSLSQIISFELPEGLTPTYIRLDFTNKEQDKIVLNNLKVEYNSKVLLVQDSLFNNYFSYYGVEIQDSIRQIKIIKDEKSFDPFIYSTDILKEKIGKLTK